MMRVWKAIRKFIAWFFWIPGVTLEEIAYLIAGDDLDG